MKKLLITMLICTCLTTIGFAIVAWKLYNCPCHHHSSRTQTVYKPTGTIGTVKGNKIGVAKGNGAVIIVGKTGRIIGIKQY